jgi:hypothetical protein
VSQWRYCVVVRGREVELREGESTFGRSRGATISIMDPSISRIHARLQARDGRLTVEDLGSANGTYINGIRLDRLAEVTDGTRLTLGESDMIVKIAKTKSPASTVRFDLRDFLCPRCGKPFPEARRECPDCAAEEAAEAMLGADPGPGTSVGLGGAVPGLLGETSQTGAGLPVRTELDPTPPPRMPPPRPTPVAVPATPVPAPVGTAARRGFWARLFGRR